MAISATQVGRRTVFGDRRVGFYNITWDSAYATGGEALTPAMLGLNDIDYVSADGTVSANGLLAYLTQYDYAAGTLQLFNSAGDGDAFDEAGTDDVSGFRTRIMVVGH